MPHQEHVQTLVQGTWPWLLSWTPGDTVIAVRPCDTLRPPIRTKCSFSGLSDAAISLLFKELNVQDVTLSGGFISAAAIAQLHHARSDAQWRLHQRISHSTAAPCRLEPFGEVLPAQCGTLTCIPYRLSVQTHGPSWRCLT